MRTEKLSILALGFCDTAATCGGSSTFSVQAHATVPVTVPLTCHEAPRTGSVAVSGALNLCPTIDSLSANPSEVQVGGTVALAAAAHDSDAGPGPLSFAWSTSAGTLSSATGQSSTFTCTAAGTATVTLSVADG